MIHIHDLAVTIIYGHLLTILTIYYIQVVHMLYLTGTTREIILNYIERNVPPGVGIEVRSFKLAQFPAELEVCFRNSFQKILILLFLETY